MKDCRDILLRYSKRCVSLDSKLNSQDKITHFKEDFGRLEDEGIPEQEGSGPQRSKYKME